MDLNADGNIDIVGAGFAGFTYVLYGKSDRSFNESIILSDKNGKNLHLGMYYNFKTNAYVNLLEEHGNIDKGDFAKFHDWDNDGDLDLIMSGGEGAYLFLNEGSKTKPAFSSKYKKIIPAYFADAFVDWDGDGLWDIVGGSKKGGAYFYKNIGKLGAPAFDKVECLFSADQIVESVNSASGGMTQIAVTDYNNDGKLDLILGNHTIITSPAPKLSKEQISDKEQLQNNLDELDIKLKSYTSVFAKENKLTDPNKIKKEIWSDEGYQKLVTSRREIQGKIYKYMPKRMSKGYVFVSLRK